jgi:resuscitation-promoting factor RpfB
MAGKVNGFAVAYTALGGLLIYSGVKGTSLTATFTDLAKGKLNSTPEASATAATGSTTATAAAGNTGAATQSAAANQALAKQIIAVNLAYAGWDTGANWQDLLSLWNRESGWSNTADNPSSHAYGIPQSLPATKMPTAAQPPPAGTSDPAAQIEWGLSYIAGRYGNPQMAWGHETANGWY